MRHLVLQVGGLAAIVTSLFLFSSLAGRVALIVAGVIVVGIGVLEELNGSRAASPAEHQGDP